MLVSILVLAGCRNPCADLCKTFQDYAETCGYEWTKDDLKACYDDNAKDGLSETELQTCDEYGDRLEDEWTCEDLAPYFDGSGGGGDGGDGGDGGSSSDTGG